MKRTLAVAVALLSLTACSAKEPPLPPALSAAQTVAEYQAEAATLQLAPGWSWPDKPIAEKAADGVDNVYEPGFGKQAADHYWYCSWTSRVLDPAVAAEERQTALANALKIKEKYYYLTALEKDSKPYLDEVLRSGQLGDYAPLKNDFELNCGQ
jgi:predicted small lipoprotein YifL